MSELQDLTAAGNSSLIPGHPLAPPRLIDWAEAETEAATQHLRTVARAAADLPGHARDALHSRAVENLKTSAFAFGSSAFDAWALSASAAPFLLWLSLRIRNPKITRNAAAEFLRRPNAESIIRAVWDLWGYRDRKNLPAPPLSAHSPNGGASLENSSSSASAPTAPRS